MPAKLISFVIPHYGRESYLVKTLQSIADQAFDLNQVEVLVVTQNKDLSQSVRCFDRALSLSILHQPVGNTISQLRNHGVRQSISTYLAFIDADIRLSSNWINCMLEELEKPVEHRVVVSSVQDYSEMAGPIEKIRSLLSRIRGDSNVDALPGSNLFLRRSTFEQVGGFPEDIKTCEDIFFTSKAAKLGNLYLSTLASHIHLGEDSNFFQLFKKEIWRGRSNYASLKGRSVKAGEFPSLVMPIFILLTAVMALAFLVLMQPLAALLCWCLSLIPTAIYVVRLQLLNKIPSLPLYEITRFYYIYFLARALGPVVGIFKR